MRKLWHLKLGWICPQNRANEDDANDGDDNDNDVTMTMMVAVTAS